MNWTWFWEVKSAVWGSAGRYPEAKACTNCHARYLKYRYYGCWTEQLHLAQTQTALASSCTKYSSLLFTHEVSGGTFHLCVKVENCVYRKVKDRVPRKNKRSTSALQIGK